MTTDKIFTILPFHEIFFEITTPAAHLKASKVWPTVNHIDNVYGDRNLFCSCIPVEDYAE